MDTCLDPISSICEAISWEGSHLDNHGLQRMREVSVRSVGLRNRQAGDEADQAVFIGNTTGATKAEVTVLSMVVVHTRQGRSVSHITERKGGSYDYFLWRQEWRDNMTGRRIKTDELIYKNGSGACLGLEGLVAYKQLEEVGKGSCADDDCFRVE